MLMLRRFEKRDEAAVIELLRHEQVKPTYMLPDMTEAEAKLMFRHFWKLSRDPERFVRAVCLEGCLIGWLNDTGISGDSIELGWVIHPAHWGRGYATEAVRSAIDLLRREGFGLVYAGAFETNAASIRVMQKCGMRLLDKTEDLDYRGKTHHCVYYGMSL